MSMERLRVAVVGAGKFGSYHAAKYSAMQNVDLVAIVDRSHKAAQQLAQKFDCTAYTRVEDVIDSIDAASITTPATTHAGLALKLVTAGIHVYIEKPLATTLADADAVLAAAKVSAAIIQCGLQERYILSRLHLISESCPTRIECRRAGAWTGRGDDVDVSLDLMIHDVDLAMAMTGEPPRVVRSSLWNEATNSHEASAVLEFPSGTEAYLFASRISTRKERTMLLVYEDGTVYIDFLAGKVHDSRPISLKTKFGDLINGADGVQYDPLGLALSDFVRCASTGEQPVIDGHAGRSVLMTTLAISSRDMPKHVVEGSSEIELFDVQQSIGRVRADVEARIARVLQHGKYINGPEVLELEQKLAQFTGAKYCLTVSSGTAALTIALMGESLSRNDAVFVPALTYNATANAVIAAGATPVFVDVDAETCNISADTLSKAIERVLLDGDLRPALVCAVDLYGKPAPYMELQVVASKYDMPILSDAAQSFGGTQGGVRVGDLADMTATSFYPSKTLGGCGDGGALFTNDRQRFEAWKQIRWHGTDSSGESIRVGLNGRLSTIQCAALLAKMSTFQDELTRRARVAAVYTTALRTRVALQHIDQHEGHAHGLFTVILSDSQERSRVRRHLEREGISCGVYYPLPLHRHGAFQKYVLHGQDLRVSEYLAERVLSLPLSPYMSRDQVLRVCSMLVQATEDQDRLMPRL